MEKVKIDEETDYQGQFKDGLRDGYGMWFVHSGKYKGDRYEGEWEKGEKKGKGIYYWADGNIY